MPDNRNTQEGERPGPELARLSRSMLELVAHLRALMLTYHHAHVNAQGPSYYGDHLLLQRLYKGTEEAVENGTSPLDEIDAVMEKWKGLVGPKAHVDAAAVAQEMALLARRQHQLAGDKLLRWFLSTENDLQYLLRRILEEAPAAVGYEIDGLSNLLQGIADRRQTNIYLLQQRLEKGAEVVAGYLQAEMNVWPDEMPRPF